MDLSSFAETLQRGLGEIPPVAIALALLAGPTLALLGYRLISVARRWQATPEVAAEPYWVCHDCRSINELNHPRCYRCSLERGAHDELEVIIDHPAPSPASFDVPAGSPFAAMAANPVPATDPTLGEGRGPGVPVMADPATARAAVPVGPGSSASPVTAPSAAAPPAAAPVVAGETEATLLERPS